MTDRRFPLYIDAYGRLIDPATIDLDRAQQQGRRERSMAFRTMIMSAFDGLFGQRSHRHDRKPVVAHDDCAAAA